MGNQRILLYFTFFFIIYMIWAQWQMEYGPQPEPATVSGSNQLAGSDNGNEAIPLAVSTGSVKNSDSTFISSTVDSVEPVSERIKVVTDVLDIEIDSKGGDIRRAVLRKYSLTADKPEEKLVLMTDASVNYHVAQSGRLTKVRPPLITRYFIVRKIYTA